MERGGEGGGRPGSQRGGGWGEGREGGGGGGGGERRRRGGRGEADQGAKEVEHDEEEVDGPPLRPVAHDLTHEL